jgi:choline dehydrogenase-like flavoprotein
MQPIDQPVIAVGSIQTDICIIGGGIAGFRWPAKFIERADVCLIESGAYAPDAETQSLHDLQYRASHQAELHGVCGISAASNLWAGRSMRLDPHRLRTARLGSNSGWPIALADVAAYYTRAKAFSNCQTRRLAGASRLFLSGTELMQLCSRRELRPGRTGAGALAVSETYSRTSRVQTSIFLNANATEIVTTRRATGLNTAADYERQRLRTEAAISCSPAEDLKIQDSCCLDIGSLKVGNDRRCRPLFHGASASYLRHGSSVGAAGVSLFSARRWPTARD